MCTNKAFIRLLSGIFAAVILLAGGCGNVNDTNTVDKGKQTQNDAAGTGASGSGPQTGSEATDSGAANSDSEPKDSESDADVSTGSGETDPDGTNEQGNAEEDGTQQNSGEEELQVVAQPDSITVLVNKRFSLPEDYVPDDLVYPDVPFIFEEMLEKRKMRKEAAEALEEMFAAAKEDKVYLAGVSAYRSHAYQKALFNSYVEKDGYEKARTYSALPGTSEHETGLAIDVSGSDGKCAAEDCFAGTPEAEWLEKNAHKFGFIVRYPEGKESITGYKYEPWHLRYVGKEAAEAIAEQGITLEEYLGEVEI